MRRVAILLVALLIALAGCAAPQEATDEDENAPDAPTEPMGPPEPAPASPAAEPAPEVAPESPPANASANEMPPMPAPTSEPTVAPTPTPAPESGDAWPRNGSYVRYRTMGGSDHPRDPHHKLVEEAIITLTYVDGAWQGMCRWTEGEMTVAARSLGESVHMSNESGSDRVAFAPLVVDADARSVRDVRGIRACELERLGAGTYAFDAWPDDWWDHDMPDWWSDESDWWDDEPETETAGDAGDSFAHWDASTGLLVAWRDARADRFTDGWLDATDAPLGEEIRSLP